MKFSMKGNKTLFQFFALLAVILCFSITANAQQVGSTGGTFGDWETEKVCYTLNGTSITLTKFSRAGDGQTSSVIKATKFFDALDQEVIPDTVNGIVVHGMCGTASVDSDTLRYFTEKDELCDFNDALVDPYFPFKRTSLKVLNTNTDSIKTLAYFDFDYEGNSYTPSGLVGLYLCAEVDTTSINNIDYEFKEICMIDSIDINNQFEYTRLIRYADTVKSYMNVYSDTHDPYTLRGAVQKRCANTANTIIDVEKLCDVDKRNLNLDINAEYKGDNTVSYVRQTSQGDLLMITNYTIDCGQGERFLGRTFVDCTCSYNNVADGTYPVTISLDLTNGGEATDIIDTYTVRDGRLYQGQGTGLISGNWVIPTISFVDINFITTPFYKIWYQDGTTKDVELDGVTPYSPSGVVEEDCQNNTLYYTQNYQPSTRPEQDLVGNECYEKSIPSGGNSWFITATINDIAGNTYNNIEDLDNLQFNGATLPLNYSYNIGGLFDEDDFINDMQNYLIANNLSFGSVSYDNGFIVINALDPSITSVTSTSIGVNSTSIAYTGDSTLLFSTTRYADNGLEKITIDHFGNETRLPNSDPNMRRVACGGGGSNSEEDCEGLQRLIHNYTFSDTLVTFPSNSIFTYTITPISGNPLVTTGGDPQNTYPTSLNSNGMLPKCYKFANEITIDTRNGSVAFVSWIE